MPKLLENDDILFAFKPSGVASHRPSEDQLGFVEWLSEKLDITLKICHRLDKDTSGVMVFGKTKEATAQLTESFTSHQVEKEYLFLSHKKSNFENWVVYEEKSKGTLLQECPWEEEGVGCQSFTEIIRISSDGPFYLYKAKPRSGKTHQIRKHATHSGVPVLGDLEYEGEVFPRLMLHCLSLKLNWKGEDIFCKAEPSMIFENLAFCLKPNLSSWISSIERRKILFADKFSSDECVRLLHSESGNLRVEQVGSKTILGWWGSTPPNSEEKKNISELMSLFKIKNWIFQWRPGAQDSRSTEVILQSDGFDSGDWSFKESNIKFQGSFNRGQNFGLFLDQRDRRSWLKDKSKDKSILNLFAFTCGFSLNGAIGGAKQVVSVDLFGKYLDWGKENFRLNGIDPEVAKYEWRKMDSFEYLKYAKKKGLLFDFIVCDPPSFSRSKKSKKVFRVERDFPELLGLCVDCLSPHGTLLFSTNFEKWDFYKWQEELEKFCKTRKLKPPTSSPSQWDYEWQKKAANLKAFFMKKA